MIAWRRGPGRHLGSESRAAEHKYTETTVADCDRDARRSGAQALRRRRAELYNEMKLQKRSKYRKQNTMAYISCSMQRDTAGNAAPVALNPPPRQALNKYEHAEGI